jgi:hypothetical protein
MIYPLIYNFVVTLSTRALCSAQSPKCLFTENGECYKSLSRRGDGEGEFERIEAELVMLEEHGSQVRRHPIRPDVDCDLDDSDANLKRKMWRHE